MMPKIGFRIGRVGAAILACSALPALSSAADAPASPLAKLIAEGASGPFCFERTYDKDHLRRHPGQRTLSMLVALHVGSDKAGEAPSVKVRLRQKGRPSPADIGASCEWGAKANRNTSGEPLIGVYPRDDGFACIALYNNNAAEEAGLLMLDIAADGRTAMAYLDDSIGLWGTLPEHTRPDDKGVWREVPADPRLTLGAEDRVFRLNRAALAACGDVERDIDLSVD